MSAPHTRQYWIVRPRDGRPVFLSDTKGWSSDVKDVRIFNTKHAAEATGLGIPTPFELTAEGEA